MEMPSHCHPARPFQVHPCVRQARASRAAASAVWRGAPTARFAADATTTTTMKMTGGRQSDSRASPLHRDRDSCHRAAAIARTHPGDSRQYPHQRRRRRQHLAGTDGRSRCRDRARYRQTARHSTAPTIAVAAAASVPPWHYHWAASAPTRARPVASPPHRTPPHLPTKQTTRSAASHPSRADIAPAARRRLMIRDERINMEGRE